MGFLNLLKGHGVDEATPMFQRMEGSALMVTACDDQMSVVAMRVVLCKATRNCNIPVLVIVSTFRMTSHVGGAV